VRVGDLLLQRGIITAEQLNDALAEQQRRGHKKLLGEVLVQMGLADEEQVLGVLAEAVGVPFTRLTPALADPRIIEVLPREFLETHLVLPLFKVRDRLTLAVTEPANVFLIDEIEQQVGCPVQIVAATARDIRATLEAHVPEANIFVLDQIVGAIGDDEVKLVDRPVTDLTDVAASAEDSPVVKLVNFIIYEAVQEGASDIHVEPGDTTLRIRYRVDGRLYEKMRPPHHMHAAVVSRIKIMGAMDISERRLPQDGGITVMLNKTPIDLRVSTMPGKQGEKVVLRIVDTRKSRANLESLGLSAEALTQFRSLIQRPNGVVLVTGPTGSGKSTTLYAALAELNTEDVNISTVEDPVEYNLEGVNQFQVHERAGFAFANALRSLLRQDPDVIMVGEVRDAETARMVTQAALTGHMVLSTLHTNDALSAVTRLVNMGVESYLVAAAVRGVLAQRLVRKVCPNCREPVEPTPAVRRSLEKMAAGRPPIDKVFVGRGCARCRNRGYAGRVGIYELLAPDDDMLDAISRGASLQELRRIAQAAGCKTLCHDGLDKVAAGITTLEELFDATAIV
jgi:type IV pilus assembly protein PilB